MNQPSWMLLRLAVETRRHHAAADADRLAPMNEPSLAGYRDYLTGVYGFEAAVEGALVQTPELDLQLIRTRTKMGRLQQDLLTLGLERDAIARLPRCALRPFRSAAEAFGWLYVVERNTLLFGLIRRHLAQHLPLTRASAYLSVYGASPGARFRELGGLLNLEAARGPTKLAAIIAGANLAFLCQRVWFTSRSGRIDDERTPLAS